MKRTIKLFGIIALVAVIGFSFAACDDILGNSGAGMLTVNGLPPRFVQDWSVWVFPAGTNISTSSAALYAMENDYEEAFCSFKIANVFPLSDTLTWETYTGSGRKEVYLQDWSDYTYGSGTLWRWYATVNFSNGNATVPFSIFTAITY